MHKRFAVAGLVVAVIMLEGQAWAKGLPQTQPADNFRSTLGQGRFAQQSQPGGAKLLEQGGQIEDKAPPNPLLQPGPNYQKDDAILQQEANIARQQAATDIIRQAQDEDLLTDGYVGNPNYFDATGGQQFGDEAFWSWPEGFAPYTFGF
jgi:hypothetical protein